MNMYTRENYISQFQYIRGKLFVCLLQQCSKRGKYLYTVTSKEKQSNVNFISKYYLNDVIISKSPSLRETGHSVSAFIYQE